MPSKTLAKFSLAAELAAKKEERKSGTKEVGWTRGGGQVKEWAKSTRQINKGVESRAARDLLTGYDVTRGNEAQRARAILTEKAKYYEKLRKGESAGLTPQQISQLMVDFDAKSDPEDSDSDDEERRDKDESSLVPRKPRSDDEDDSDDPVVEYQDEFGRTRTARQSRVPRAALARASLDEDEQVDDAHVYTGDQTHFPVYEPTPEELAARRAAHGETSSKGPLNVHYDAHSELRDRGAAHRVLARDEASRSAQRAEFEAEHARIKSEQEREAQKRAVVKSAEELKREERMQQIQANRQRILDKRKAAGSAPDEPGAKRPL